MPKVETAAKLTADMCYKYKDRFLASLIIAGWDDTVTVSISGNVS